MATLTTKQLTAQLADLQAQLITLQAKVAPTLTPFAPASAASLLVGVKAPASFAKQPVWQSTGSAPTAFTLPDPHNPTAAPTVKNGAVSFNNSPLLGSLPGLGAFTVFVPVYLPTTDQDGLLLSQGDLYGFDLRISNGSFTASLYQQDGRQVTTPARPGWNVVVFSREKGSNLVRLAANGQLLSVKDRNFQAKDTGGALWVGGKRGNDGIVRQGVTALIPEFAIFSEQSVPLQRKLEGYARLTYGVQLPDGHYFASKVPVAENVYDADLSRWVDAAGTALVFTPAGRLLQLSKVPGAAYVQSDLTYRWKDSSYLSLDTVDSRTQGPIGSVFYTVAFADDQPHRYYETSWEGGRIDLRAFDITPTNADCSDAFEAVSAYLPREQPETLLLQGGRSHSFSRGLRLLNRNHFVTSTKPTKYAVIAVPPGVGGGVLDADNGQSGGRLQYLEFYATGKDASDIPDLTGKPTTGWEAADYAYIPQVSGLNVTASVDVRDCAFTDFSGPAIKTQAYINKQAPTAPGSKNANGNFFDNIKVRNCYAGLLLNGSDANAGRYTNFDVRECANYALIDDSQLGNYFFGWVSHNNKAGTYAIRGLRNSAVAVGLYAEEQSFLPGDTGQAAYGAYFGGNATVVGGTMSPEGSSGRPGSAAYKRDNAQIICGNFSSGITTGAVSLVPQGLDFQGGLTFLPKPTDQGFHWVFGAGYEFRYPLLELLSPGNQLLASQRVAQDFFVNLPAPAINGLRALVVDSPKGVETAVNRDGTPRLYYPGERVFVQDGSSATLVCVSGGQFLGDDPKAYQTGLSGRVVALDIGYGFQVQGDQPIPPLNSTILLNGTGPYFIGGGDFAKRVYTFSPQSPPITDFELRTITLAKPVFRLE